MPTVPMLEAPDVAQEPLPGRAYPRFDENVPDAAYGGPVAEGLQNVSQAATQVDAQFKAQHDQLRVIDANTQLEAGLAALQYGKPDQNGTMQGGAFSLHGTDAMNLPAKFIPEYQKMADSISSTLTPDQQALFKPHIAAGQAKLNVELNRYEYQESDRLANQIFTSGTDQAVASAATGWRDPLAIGKARLDLKALVSMQGDKEGWDPATREVQTRAALARLDGGVIDSMLAAGNSKGAQSYFESARDEIAQFNPKVAEEIQKNIQAGRVTDTANSVLSAYKSNLDSGARALLAVQKSDLPPEQQAQVIGLVERGRSEYAQAQAQDPHNRAQLTALHDSIASGTVTPQAAGTVDALWRRGALTDDQRTTMRDEVLRAQKKGNADQEAVDYVRSALADGRPLDPKEDKNAVDTYFRRTTPDPAGSTGYNNSAVSLTSKTGVVPDSAVSYIRASLVGGQPAEKAKAAQLAASLQRSNPAAYLEGIDKETRSLASTINDAVAAGASPESAVAMATEAAKRSETQQEFLKKQWDDLVPRGQSWENYDRHAIARDLKNDPAWQIPGILHGIARTVTFGSDVPRIPDAMAADYQTILRDNFMNHTGGNLPQAHQNAMNDLKGVWGLTEVNGKREPMKYAPELMFPGLTADDIRADMAKKGYGAAHLVESIETGSSGGKVWNLQEPDKFGAWTTVRDENNMPVRYQLPQPDAKARSFEAQEQQFKDEETARAARANRDAAREAAAERALGPVGP
jgi:hypothetical protein